MKKLLLALVAIGLTSCASSPVQDLGLQYIVAKTIEQSSDPAKLATRVVRAAEDAKILIDLKPLTPAELQVVLLERLAKSDLSPADKLLLSALVSSGVSYLAQRIEAGNLPEDFKLTANRLLSLVSAAAGVYVPNEPEA
jgi:hypothetical protein